MELQRRLLHRNESVRSSINWSARMGLDMLPLDIVRIRPLQRMAWACVPALLICLSAPVQAHAQGIPGGDSCRMLASRVAPAGDLTLTPSPPHLMARLDTIVWRWVRARRDSSVERREPWEQFAGTLESLRTDSAMRRDAAVILARMFRVGNGPYDSDDADVASLLYQQLRLPPAAARGVLADRGLPPLARQKALVALRPSEFEPWYPDAIFHALCDVAASAAGKSAVWLEQDQADPYVLVRATMDASEREFLWQATRGLMSRPDAPEAVARAQRLFGAFNPVARYMESGHASVPP